MRVLRLTLSPLVICALLYCQTSLDDTTILKLVKAGIGEDTIVGMVNQQQGRYALSADDMIALKTAGVSDKIIAAMVVRNGAASEQPPIPTAPTISTIYPSPLILHDA